MSITHQPTTLYATARAFRNALLSNYNYREAAGAVTFLTVARFALELGNQRRAAALAAPRCSLCEAPAVLIGEQWVCRECGPSSEPELAPSVCEQYAGQFVMLEADGTLHILSSDCPTVELSRQQMLAVFMLLRSDRARPFILDALRAQMMALGMGDIVSALDAQPAEPAALAA